MKKTFQGTLTEVLDFIVKKGRKIATSNGKRQGDVFFVDYIEIKQEKE